MSSHTFVLNGEKVTVDVEPGVRLLWPDGVETDAACPTATGLLPG